LAPAVWFHHRSQLTLSYGLSGLAGLGGRHDIFDVCLSAFLRREHRLCAGQRVRWPGRGVKAVSGQQSPFQIVRPSLWRKYRQLTIYVLVRGFDVCFWGQLRVLPGSNCGIIDFVLRKTILKPSIPKPSVSIHFATASRDYFANPVPEGNANYKN
jgi:hypothetical protein